MACTTEQVFELVVDSDYKALQGRAVELDFCSIDGFTVGVCTGRLGFYDGTNSLIVTVSTVTDNGDGTWKVSFDIDQADTVALPPGRYKWQISIVEGSEEVIVGRSTNQREEILWLAKLT